LLNIVNNFVYSLLLNIIYTGGISGGLM